MKYIKKIAFRLLFIAFFYPIDLIAIDAAGVKAVRELGVTVNRALPKIEKIAEMGLEASKNIENGSKCVGMGTIMFLGDKLVVAGKTIATGVAKVGAAVKTGATIVISSPATPYIVVGVGLVGGGIVIYKVYYYYHPTTGEKIVVAEQKAQLYKAKTEAYKSKTEANKVKIELYNSEVEVTEAKKSMLAKIAVGMAFKVTASTVA